MSDTDEGATSAKVADTAGQGQDLLSVFEKLGAKPKAKTPEELMQWMKDFVKYSEDLEPKQEDKFNTSMSHPAWSGVHGHLSSPKQVVSHQLRLPPFSGDAKIDTSYELWRYEAACLQKDHHSPQIVLQSIRRSLKNEAANVVMRLGPDASIHEIFHKLDSCYGEVEQPEMLLAKFYSARQRKDESVSSWGCRLEDLLNKAILQGKVNATDTENMLRVMFWSGLCDELKDITGHLYERISDFDQLRVAIRRVEQDHKRRNEEHSTATTKKATPCKPAIVEDQQLGEIKGLIQQLSTEMQAMKTDQQKMKQRLENPPQQPQRRNYGNPGQQQHTRPDYQRQGYQQGQGSQQNQQGQQELHEEPRQQDAGPRNAADPIICWRCGQEGHISLGCRVRLDHRRRPLNSNRPVPRGRH